MFDSISRQPKVIRLGILIALVLATFSSPFSAQIDSCTNTGRYYIPQPVADGVIRFAMIGDYGNNTEDERRVAELIKSWNPDFIVTTGDNNYPVGAKVSIDTNIGQYYSDFIGNYQGNYGQGSDVNRFFPSLGNHDWLTANAQPYLDYFTLPGNERYYDFVKGSVHFFITDSHITEPDGITIDSKQAEWLREKISVSTAPFKLVINHHPPYSSGAHGSSVDLRWDYAGLGVDAVFSGHEHSYERLVENGVTYVVNGVGGMPLRPFYTILPSSQIRNNCDHGAMLIEATNRSMLLRLITHEGLIVDEFNLISKENIVSTYPMSVAWDPKPEAIRYKLIVVNLNTRDRTVQEILPQQCGTICSATVTNILEQGNEYKWKVKAIYPTEKQKIAKQRFRVVYPEAITLFEPAMNRVIDSPQALSHFSWQALTHGTKYKIVIKKALTKEKITTLSTTCAPLSFCSVIVPQTVQVQLANNQQYFWKLKIRLNDGRLLHSPKQYFMTNFAR